jgi:hypothetical protein
MKFMERIRENLTGYHKIKGDTKSDVLRIAEKLEQYKTDEDSTGLMYIKDIVRMAFYFPDALSLKEAFIEFQKKSSPSCLNVSLNHGYKIMNEGQKTFTIMEIKSKLTTPLQNVTMVVCSVGGAVIGEV